MSDGGGGWAGVWVWASTQYREATCFAAVEARDGGDRTRLREMWMCWELVVLQALRQVLTVVVVVAPARSPTWTRSCRFYNVYRFWAHTRCAEAMMKWP